MIQCTIQIFLCVIKQGKGLHNVVLFFIWQLDYKFSNLVGGFTVDVNFTLQGDGHSYMTMLVETDPLSAVHDDICQGLVKLISPADQTLCGTPLANGTTIQGDEIVTITSPCKIFDIFLIHYNNS